MPKHAVNLKRMIRPSWRPDRDAGTQFLGAGAGQKHHRLGEPGAGRHETAGRCFAAGLRSPLPRRPARRRPRLAALRMILSACHARVIPNQLALSFADEAYDEMDQLKNSADIEALEAWCGS